jgi:diguanylate cyclase (GGDEF)-like protein
MKRAAITSARRLAAALAALLATLAASSAPAAPAPLRALQQQLDTLVRDGAERPAEALQALQGLQDEHAGEPAAERSIWLARGLVEAQDGRAAPAGRSASHLAGLPASGAAAPVTDAASDALGDPMADADAELVRAVLSDTEGRLDQAAEHAQAALADYERLCGKGAEPPRDDCDYRSRWRALQLLARRAYSEGIDVSARDHWQTAADLARDAGDPGRQANSLALLAVVTARDKAFESAQRVLQQARRVAEGTGEPEPQARVKIAEALLAAQQGDDGMARAALSDGLALAQQARSPRLQALFLNNLADEDVKHGRPREALQEAEQALPIVREHHDRRSELSLLHNASLARLALHEIEGAKHSFEQTLPLWREEGEAREAQAMREFGDALAAAGDYAGALDLYHRERQLTAQIQQRGRDAALHELQARYGREAQQRDIELLARDNALKTAELHNRALLQRVWALLAVTLAVALVFVVLLYLRVRETQRQLERSHAKLRVQSERDPLTGLANRRHFQDVMRAQGAHEAFEGALLLIDIDHFKHVNDQYGHAAGDEVLVQTAQRLQDAVREKDLVARWGGEEFLVFAPKLAPEALAPLAERLQQAISSAPMQAGGRALRITASLGLARFPLPVDQLPQTWEHAVNFVDMALYTAKSLGRHRAVAITAVQAANAEALHAIERDFEAAWADGRVTLDVMEGRAAEPGNEAG